MASSPETTRTPSEQFGDIRQALDTWLRENYNGRRSIEQNVQNALDQLWDEKLMSHNQTTDSPPDTVTVSAPIYGLYGIVIGHYSITVPRSEAERLSITFPITLQPAETESDAKQS